MVKHGKTKYREVETEYTELKTKSLFGKINGHIRKGKEIS